MGAKNVKQKNEGAAQSIAELEAQAGMTEAKPRKPRAPMPTTCAYEFDQGQIVNVATGKKKEPNRKMIYLQRSGNYHIVQDDIGDAFKVWLNYVKPENESF